jgi:LPXTG-motif cell wall-anchored protein
VEAGSGGLAGGGSGPSAGQWVLGVAGLLLAGGSATVLLQRRRAG